MENLLNCDTCRIVEDYDITLCHLNVDRKDGRLPSKLTVGLNVNNSTFERLPNNEIIVKVLTKITGLDKKEEDELFNISVLYSVLLKLRPELDMVSENETLEASLKDYAFFVLYPTLRSVVEDLGSKIDIPGLKLPLKNRAQYVDKD